MITHPRVRKYIFACLENKATGHAGGTHRSSAAFQLAFCYKIGFGTPSNERVSQHWLQETVHSAEDLDLRIQWAKKTVRRNDWRNGNLVSLIINGILTEDATWLNTENLEVLEAEYKRELRDMQHIFGKDSLVVLKLSLHLVQLLEREQKYIQAEMVCRETLEVSSIQNLVAERGTRPKYYSRGHRKSSISMEKLSEASSASPFLERIIAATDEPIPETRFLAKRLASIYVLQERWGEAEWIYLHLRNMEQRDSGECHPETLFLSYMIASTYKNQGRLTEAEALLSYVLDRQKKFLGIEHKSTRNSMGLLASIYSVQGRTKEAESLETQLVDIYKKLFGPRGPHTLFAMSELSVELAKQGRWEEAKNYAQEALIGRRQVLGEDHPDTLRSMNDLAAIRRKMGFLAEAQALFLTLIETQEQILGKDHFGTLVSKRNLAMTYKGLGLLREAENLSSEVVETQTRILGSSHIETLRSMGILAWIYSSQDRLHAAESLYLHVIEKMVQTLHRNHPSCQLEEVCLAEVYIRQKRFIEAQELLSPIIKNPSEQLGERPRVCLARVLTAKGQYGEASYILKEVVEKRTKTKGLNHWSTLDAMHDLAVNLSHQHQHEEANALFIQVIGQRGRLQVQDEQWGLIDQAMQDQILNFCRHGCWRDAVLHACSFVRWRWDTDFSPALAKAIKNKKFPTLTPTGQRIALRILLPPLFIFIVIYMLRSR